MSQYPEAISDLAWFRQEIEGLQAQVRELQRGPAVPQPVLTFTTRALRNAVVGSPMQWCYVSNDPAPGNNGPFQYFPGTGWKRPIGAETGSLVQMGGATLPAYTLPFTGGTYNVTDYPDLASYYGIVSGTFTLFNSGGRALIGAGTVADANNTVQTFTTGTKGGEITHIMTVAEMPAHGHGVYGNGMPMQLVDSYATDAAGYNRYRFAAGASQLAALSTGGSSAFSLMQPYGVFPIALRF